MISVLVASASAVGRAGLRAMVSANPAFTVAGHANGWKDLPERVAELQPDVILIDEPGTIPFDSPPVIVLSEDAGFPLVRAGARAVLPASSGAHEIAAAIEAVSAGLIVLHPDLIDHQPVPLAVDSTLTTREIEVLRMLAEGLANKEIAYRLGISDHTVKFHVASLFSKLHASSRTEAVTLGVRQGLILL